MRLLRDDKIRRVLSALLAVIMIIVCACAMTGCGHRDEKEVRVFCYGDYIDPAVVKSFQKETGIKVVLDTYDTVEEMYPVIKNRAAGQYTHVYIDEIYLFFAKKSMSGNANNGSDYSGEFLYKCWKRFRKYYATLTGITQNVEECLLSDTARMMFANSEFLMMFNQAPTDREDLSRLLGTSAAQMDYVSNAPPGQGLIKVGGSIVPFVNEFPKDTSLYKLMTTKPGEG